MDYFFPPFFLCKRGLLELEKTRTGVELKFYELCNKVVGSEGLELYGLDYNAAQSLLRLFIQNSETKTANLEDCAKIDRALTPSIEEEEWMPTDLTLEVSSPGVYRDIKEAKWMSSFIGERICLVLSQKLEEKYFFETLKIDKKLLKDKKIFIYLKNFDGENITFSNSSEQEAIGSIPVSIIKRANIEPLWEDLKDNQN